jgi:uncharacterized membrane protein
MGLISNKITIGTPASDVYSYVSNPLNLTSYISAMRRVDPSSGGEVWQAEAELLGKVRDIELRITHARPNRLVHYSISGDPRIEIEMRLRPAMSENATDVELIVDVAGVPPFLLNSFLGNMLSGDLKRLKALLERRA